MVRDKFLMGYTFNADVYCYECGHNLPDVDGDGNDKGAIASWHLADMLDSYCGKCGGGIK